ncbi:GNAT family acetyltransferase [Gulosibacter macacae]|uniref:GNAT family acetyltransferase n=1 Tax=Gulosibacter macacae TaxID=2488791 RepID=UPI001F2F252C|nr:GNAT family acetyltransferase [Gulosibacter macacae]
MTFAIRPLGDADADAAVALWHEVGLTRPWNDPHADFARALATWPELLLGAFADEAADGEVLVGTVLGGYDGHRGWVYYLASAPSHRGAGIGRALMAEIERRLEAQGCPKLQLMVRSDNTSVLAFYDHLGYAVNEVAVLGKRLIAD